MKSEMTENHFNSLDYILGADDAARKWNLSPGTIKNYCSEGRLIAKKVGKTWVIDRNQPDPKRRIQMELIEITSRYNRVLSSQRDQYEKDKAYAAIMTDMEKQFQIPMMKDEGYEKDHSDILDLYRRISMSRESL